MPRRLNFSIDWVHLGLLIVLAGTLLNGFYITLIDEYATSGTINDWTPHGTFLGSPHDIHADLIELDLSYPPFTKIDTSSWPNVYRKYAAQNVYHSLDLSQIPPVDVSSPGTLLNEPARTQHQPASVLTGLHVTPPMLLVGMLTKWLILFWGPGRTVLLHYVLALLGLGLACCLIVRDETSRLWAFFALTFSFPFLVILNWCNQGALITSFSLIFFLYLVCTGERYVSAALLLALACCFRPNAVLLAPLLYCFGPRYFLASIAIFASAMAIGGGLSYHLDQLLYPGYSLSAFTRALDNYFKGYVLDGLGTGGNNSAFGAFQAVYLFPSEVSTPNSYSLFIFVNKVLAGTFLLGTIWGWILFAYGKLSKMEFAYVNVAIYILASTVFATYHLFVIAIFPLLFCRERDARNFGWSDHLILFSSVFLLVPKVYVQLNNEITPGVLLNPLVLLLSLGALLIARSGLLPGVERQLC